MQDTSPARKPRDNEPVPGRVADGDTSEAVTWYEKGGEPPADDALIALIPLPEL